MDYDPVPVFERLTVPVLAIVGDRDLHVPPGDEAKIEGLVRGTCETCVVEGMSHILRPDPEWLGPRGYRRAVRRPVCPEVLDVITEWIGGQANHPPPGG